MVNHRSSRKLAILVAVLLINQMSIVSSFQLESESNEKEADGGADLKKMTRLNEAFDCLNICAECFWDDLNQKASEGLLFSLN